MEEKIIKGIKESFLAYCKWYGEKHPARERERPVWHEGISERVRKVNEEIVEKIFSLADKNPGVCNPAAYAYPVVWANGYKYGKDRNGNKYKKKEDKNPFGNFSMLPKYAVDYAGYSFNSVLEPMGLYAEAWSNYQFDVAENAEIITEEEREAFYGRIRSEEEVFVYRNAKDVPNILMDIGRVWGKLAELAGDIGCCVVGAGMSFRYNGQAYRLATFSPWQGEGSWSPHEVFIRKCLEAIGAAEIRYNFGRMD